MTGEMNSVELREFEAIESKLITMLGFLAGQVVDDGEMNEMDEAEARGLLREMYAIRIPKTSPKLRLKRDSLKKITALLLSLEGRLETE